MALLPKTLMKWKEPKRFGRALYSHDSKSSVWWQNLIAVFIVSLFGMFLWWLARFSPSKDPVDVPLATGLSVFLGVFVVYLVPLVGSYFPNCIKISDVGILGRGCKVITWERVREAKVSDLSGYKVIIFTIVNDRDLVLGCSNDFNEEELRGILELKSIILESEQVGG